MASGREEVKEFEVLVSYQVWRHWDVVEVGSTYVGEVAICLLKILPLPLPSELRSLTLLLSTLRVSHN